MVQYKYISADNHIDLRWLPKRLWQDRLANRLKEAGPKVVETTEGSMWEWEGKLQMEAADGSRNAKLRERFFGARGVDTPEGSLPPCEPELLLAHLDIAGIYAGVFYGEPFKWDVKDAELRKAIYRSYNDFILDFIRHAPDRLVILPTLPTMHPELCADEMTRVVRQGAKAVEFSVFDADPPVWDPVWERLWSTAEELGIPIGCHIGFRATTKFPPNIHGQLLAHYGLAPMSIAPAMAQLIFSGVLERHPTLHFSFAECRVGWIPFVISWLDRQVGKRQTDPTIRLSLLPSEYFARQISVTFEDDLIGARLVPMDWAYLKDSAIWGADYPHAQGVWPQVEPMMDKMFDGVDRRFVEEVVFNRAARIFKLNPPPPARA